MQSIVLNRTLVLLNNFVKYSLTNKNPIQIIYEIRVREPLNLLIINKIKVIEVNNNNNERNFKNKVIKVYLTTTRIRADLENIISEAILLIVK